VYIFFILIIFYHFIFFCLFFSFSFFFFFSALLCLFFFLREIRISSSGHRHSLWPGGDFCISSRSPPRGGRVPGPAPFKSGDWHRRVALSGSSTTAISYRCVGRPLRHNWPNSVRRHGVTPKASFSSDALIALCCAAGNQQLPDTKDIAAPWSSLFTGTKRIDGGPICAFQTLPGIGLICCAKRL